MTWLNMPRGKEPAIYEWLQEYGLEKLIWANARGTIYRIGFRDKSHALLFKLTWGGA